MKNLINSVTHAINHLPDTDGFDWRVIRLLVVPGVLGLLISWNSAWGSLLPLLGMLEYLAPGIRDYYKSKPTGPKPQTPRLT